MSIPFSLETYEGLAEVEGVVRFEDDALILEFRTRDAIFGVVKSELEEIRIPLAELAGMELAKGIFSTKLEVRTVSMRALADCPGSRAGAVKLGVKREHRQAAEELATDVTLRIGEHRMDVAMRDAERKIDAEIGDLDARG